MPKLHCEYNAYKYEYLQTHTLTYTPHVCVCVHVYVCVCVCVCVCVNPHKYNRSTQNNSIFYQLQLALFRVALHCIVRDPGKCELNWHWRRLILLVTIRLLNSVFCPNLLRQKPWRRIHDRNVFTTFRLLMPKIVSWHTAKILTIIHTLWRRIENEFSVSW